MMKKVKKTTIMSRAMTSRAMTSRAMTATKTMLSVMTATGPKKIYRGITKYMVTVVDDESSAGYFAGGKEVLVVVDTMGVIDPVGHVKLRRFLVTCKIGIATADGRTVTHDTITAIGNCKIDDYDTVVELMTKIVKLCPSRDHSWTCLPFAL